jgi:hypothetical protein
LIIGGFDSTEIDDLIKFFLAIAVIFTASGVAELAFIAFGISLPLPILGITWAIAIFGWVGLILLIMILRE